MLSPEDEPATKRAADAASNASQRAFMRRHQGQLVLLCVTAILSGYSPPDPGVQRAVVVVTAVIMLTALALAFELKVGRYDDKWFRCRAVAENVKSAMWRYVMSARDAEADEVRATFTARVAEICERLPGLSALLALHRVEGVDITNWMESGRNMALDAKLVLFRDLRIRDQIAWYSARARFNATWERRWQWVVLALEFSAIGLAAAQAWLLSPFNGVGGIAAVSAALVAWTQTKRHSDLSNTYAVAAEDLRRISARREHVRERAEIDMFVDEVEAAISREHSLWLAKRVN